MHAIKLTFFNMKFFFFGLLHSQTLSIADLQHEADHIMHRLWSAGHGADLARLNDIIQSAERIEDVPRKPYDALLLKAYVERSDDTLSGAELYLRTVRLGLTGYMGQTPEFDGSPFHAGRRISGSNGCKYCFTLGGLAKLWHLGNVAMTAWRHNVTGDILEAGTWQGGMGIYVAAMAAAYPELAGDCHQTRIVLADTFTGIPETTSVMSEAFWSSLPLSVGGRERVERNFDLFGLLSPCIRFVQGAFATSLPELRVAYLTEGRQLSILRIDSDTYESYMDVLYNLYDLVSLDGYIICDDCRCVLEADRAIIGFMRHHGLLKTVKTIPGSECGVFFRKDDESAVDTITYDRWLLQRRHVQKFQDSDPSGQYVEELLAVAFLENRAAKSVENLMSICDDSRGEPVLLWALPSVESVGGLSLLDREAIRNVAEALSPTDASHCVNVVTMTLDDYVSAQAWRFGPDGGVHWSHPSGAFMVLVPLCGANVKMAADSLALFHEISLELYTHHLAANVWLLRSWLSFIALCPRWSSA